MKRLIYSLSVLFCISLNPIFGAVSPHTQDDHFQPPTCQRTTHEEAYTAYDHDLFIQTEFHLISNRQNNSQIEKQAMTELAQKSHQVHLKYALYILYSSCFLFGFLPVIIRKFK